MNKPVAILLFLCCCAVGTVQTRAAAGDTVQAPTTYSQYIESATERDITEAQWKQLTDDEKLDYKDEQEEKEIKKEKKASERPGKSLLEKIFDVLFSKEGRYVIWTVLFLVLGYAIIRFIIGEKSFLFARGKKQVVADAVETTEEDLLEMNWEKKLEEMLKKGDLRQAIRYSYMWMLQMLQEKNLINYRIDKTNYEYAAELKDEFKQPFRQITRQYEYAWYGHYPVNDESYNKFREEFIQIRKQISSN